MSRKHVLIAVSNYPPAFGGAGLQVHRLYTRLSKHLPIEITTLTQSGRGLPPGRDRHEGVQVWRIDPNTALTTQFLAVSRFVLQHRSRPFDLLHASDSAPIVLSACLWARLLGIPTIREITLPAERTSVAWKARLIRSTFAHADLLFGVNDSVLAEYEAMEIPRERIWSNVYPVNIDQFQFPTPEQRKSARAPFGFMGDDVVHFVLGRIQARKNQHLALEMLALLPENHKLILAGPAGDETYMNRIHRTIVEKGVKDRVVLLPENQPDPAPLYHASDVYLVTSTREAGPNVMLEALCCGVPVIVNEKLGVRRFVHDGVHGFNVPFDAEQFAQAACRLTGTAQDPDRRRAIAEKSAEMFGAPSLDPQYAQHIARLLRM
jgi:glycosyltransferase involved in cell wall biosynthesis